MRERCYNKTYMERKNTTMTETNYNGFHRTPRPLLRRILADDALTLADVKTLLAAMLAEHEPGEPVALGTAATAARIGMSESVVKRAKRRLRTSGYLVETVSNSGQVTLYALAQPEGVDATTRVVEDSPPDGGEDPGTRVRYDPGRQSNTYDGNKGDRETETASSSSLPQRGRHVRPPRRSVPKGCWDPFENYVVTPDELARMELRHLEEEEALLRAEAEQAFGLN